MLTFYLFCTCSTVVADPGLAPVEDLVAVVATDPGLAQGVRAVITQGLVLEAGIALGPLVAVPSLLMIVLSPVPSPERGVAASHVVVQGVRVL